MGVRLYVCMLCMGVRLYAMYAIHGCVLVCMYDMHAMHGCGHVYAVCVQVCASMCVLVLSVCMSCVCMYGCIKPMCMCVSCH